jgi:hypothetical protein
MVPAVTRLGDVCSKSVLFMMRLVEQMKGCLRATDLAHLYEPRACRGLVYDSTEYQRRFVACCFLEFC